MPPNEISTIELFIRTWGPWIAIPVIFLYFKVWPLVERMVPARMQSLEKRMDEKAKADEEDRLFRQQIERERAVAAKVTSDAIQALSQTMVETNVRIAQIMTNQASIQATQNAILQALNDAVSDMKEVVARREGYEARKRETGPLGDRREEPK